MTGPGTATRRKPTAADLAAGRRLRRLRLAAGLTQAEIADALGVSYQQASKYEIGETRPGQPLWRGHGMHARFERAAIAPALPEIMTSC